MYWMRIGMLDGIRPLLTQYFGLDLNQLEKQIRFDFSILDNLENQVPLDAAIKLLDDCAKITNCEHFGGLLASQQPKEIFGLLLLLGESAERFEAALNQIIQNINLSTSGVTWQIEKEQDNCFLMQSLLSERSSTQAHLFSMAQSFYFFKSITQSQWQPKRVYFTVPKPANLNPWTQIFGNNLHFNMDFTGYIFNKEQLSLKTTRHDKVMLDMVTDYLTLTGKTPQADRIHQMKTAIRSLILLRQNCKLKDIAASQNQSTRAIQYYLKKHNTSYQKILDETRYDIAKELLAESEQRISAIANLIGFAESSVFTRGFKKQTGTTPMEYRRRSIARKKK